MYLAKNKRQELQGTFPASGVLTVSDTVPLGPSRDVKQIAISTTNTANETLCTTYIGTNSAGVLISQSFTGNNDTDSQPNVSLRSGDSLCAVWTGGAVGTIARLTYIYDEVDY